MIFNHPNLQENIPLRDLTTFGIGGPARYYLRAETADDLIRAWEAAQRAGLPVFLLGGGSNILVSDRGFPGLVLHVATQGITTLAEDGDTVTLRAAAGENWDRFVALTVESGWWGVENLSAIPGSVGAFPIQNVGAYGQEASDVVRSVEVWDTWAGTRATLTNADCRFGYRSSLFNTTHRERYLVLSVTLQLSKTGQPNLSYQGLRDFFSSEPPTRPGQMRAAVTRLRESKLPAPEEIGSAGSFFKNILLSEDEFNRLRGRVQESLGQQVAAKLATFRERLTTPEGIKIPTAYLIEACGLRGASLGGAALSPHHALIMTNANGSATADEVMRLARRVRHTVHAQTGLAIRIEPTLVGFGAGELKAYLALEG